MTKSITVRSHVGRDLLQNAAYFSTVPKVVWEYVSNAIDNPGPSGSVVVDVVIQREQVTVEDDGAGMTRSDLARFFEMHGENIQRKQGKRVRGQFGTGKCAAFGIGCELRIETVKGGRLNVVELRVEDIQRSSGDEFPVREETIDAQTNATDGTRVVISRLNTRQLEIPATIGYVQRHLGRQQQRNKVLINGHLCEFDEPVSVKEVVFDAPASVAAHLGVVRATVRLAASPLGTESFGIDVTSYDIWHDTTLAGLAENDVTRRIFGDIDVPALEDYVGSFPPFDNTRNNTLSPQNPLVVVLFGWLAECISKVVADVTAEEAARRRSAESKALRSEADKIQAILNDDFRSLQLELEKARRHSPERSVPSDELAGVGRRDEESEHILPDSEGDLSVEAVAAGLLPGAGQRRSKAAGIGATERPGSGLLPGDGVGTQRQAIERQKSASGFTVDFAHETEAAHRSRYDRSSRTIYINLDHPQVASAERLGGRAAPAFRQLAYELAVVEYAMALGVESEARDAYYGGEQAIYEIRDVVNRVSRRLGALFS